MTPTYNERENIILMLDALTQVSQQLPQYQVTKLVLDDNSPDGTGDLVTLYAKKDYQTRLLSGQKQGLGKALIKGYQHAISDLKADIVVSIDADFLFDPFDIPRLLEQIEHGYDVVIGSRHNKHGFKVVGWPMGRYVTHWVANNFFATIIAGVSEVHDHNGNFRAIRVHNILDQVPWNKLPTKGYGFLNYMIYELSKTNAKFTEVPVTLKWRERGESKVSFNPKYIRTFMRDTLEYISLCFKIRADRHRSWRSLVVARP